ncbi:MAG TPA: sulfatase-like hydrolase/transferase [Acidimicrobiales bacterium]
MSGTGDGSGATRFTGRIGRTLRESEPAWPPVPHAAPGAPNIVLFVLDDVGFAQPSAYGGGCEMPALDRLAATGLRYTNFHATALCSPTRACLLSGRNHHSVGIGALVELSMGFPGYHGMAGPDQAFLPAILREAGYNTFAIGKWHLTPPTEASSAGPYRAWPLGRGFERYYGFMGGDTSQWFPELVQDNTFIPPPGTPEDGYHLNADLADHAIQMIKDAHVAAPDKPFFLYYAAGAGHAPHHVEPAWVEPYRCRFDHGWDAYRGEVFDRQLAAGVVPGHARLSVRDPDVPPWDDLDADSRRMFARQMEVYAGFLTQTDHHFGRVLDFIGRLGEGDNTIVVALSDNGASAEGGPAGTFNEALFFNFVPERLEDNLRHFDGWGGVDTFPHYSWGWTWAGTTPFRRWKRETYRGGVSEPCIVSWPAGIGDHGTVRAQYAHAIDILPTLLDAAGVPLPETVAGVAQQPFHGASFAPTFTDAEVPPARTTQYFEMHGYRALDHDGWRAVCPFGGPSLAEAAARGRDFRFTELTPELLAEMDRNEWELFDLAADPSETTDLAAAEPERLRAMIDRWYEEAERYGVLPLASPPRPGGRLLGNPSAHSVEFLPGAAPLAFTVAPRLAGRSYSITADVTIPPGGASGVLLTQGGRLLGFALYLQDGRLHHALNYVGLEQFRVASPEPVPEGRQTLRYEFETTGGPVDFLNGQGVPGRSKLYVGGSLVAVAPVPYSPVAGLGWFGITCGYAQADSVDPAAFRPPSRFTGEIERVVLDLSGSMTADDGAVLSQLMAHQ